MRKQERLNSIQEDIIKLWDNLRYQLEVDTDLIKEQHNIETTPERLAEIVLLRDRLKIMQRDQKLKIKIKEKQLQNLKNEL